MYLILWLYFPHHHKHSWNRDGILINPDKKKNGNLRMPLYGSFHSYIEGRHRER